MSMIIISSTGMMVMFIGTTAAAVAPPRLRLLPFFVCVLLLNTTNRITITATPRISHSGKFGGVSAS